MPMFDFTCRVCGAKRRVWRYEGQLPKYCSRACQSRGQAGQNMKPVKHRVTPEAAAQIRALYQQVTGGGEVKALAAKLGLPRWKVTRYAINQGWLATTKKGTDWTEAELAVLERNAHLSPERIRQRLKANGFNRSETGIVLKRRRLNLLANLDGQSATSLAACFGVNPSTVAHWIKKGWLKARLRGTQRDPGQGGDIYYILDKHVRQFVVDYPNQVDLRKVDKFWFIAMLAD